MARKPVHYFFAFSSPFAALADARIDDLVARAGAELVPIPVVPPPPDPPQGLAATIQQFKLSYAAEDSARWARRLGLAWNPPPAGPVDNTPASAGWYFARERGRERAYRNTVFQARFAAGRDVSDPEVLADCAAAAGLPRGEFLEALRTRRYHDEVPKALALCVQERVFGVPLFVVDGKRFWGNDRVDALVEELGRG
jgi:2-hydroxychromene-2-carboxylate isomerase